jgi:hypothetical protein
LILLALDPSYERFVGEPQERVYYDWSVRAYRRMIVCEPIKPSDALPPADPDQQLQYDPLLRVKRGVPAGTPNSMDAAIAAVKERSAKRHAACQEAVIAYLQKYGSARAIKLAVAIGETRMFVQDHLKDREGTVYVASKKGQHVFWSLLP